MDAELGVEDADRVLAPQGADAVGLGGPGQHALAEGLFLVPRQLGGPALAGLGPDRVEPAVAVGVGPGLHEVAAAAEHGADHRLFEPVEGQAHRPQPVALQGVLLDTQAAVEFGQIVGVVGRDVHRPIVADAPAQRKTEHAPYRACGLITMRMTGVTKGCVTLCK